MGVVMGVVMSVAFCSPDWSTATLSVDVIVVSNGPLVP